MKQGIKNLFWFLGGVATTIMVLVMIGMAAGNPNNGISWFAEKGNCISKSSIQVLQALNPMGGLATEKSDYGYNGKVVLIVNDKNESYYDEQIINLPQGKCLRQYGTYEYQTRDERWKTVPVVMID